ncbi:MAG TPA: hypothetical protein VMZ33_02595 [Candidatus Limnocylindrales bacterium]|nr:hypothetical protein [Candidatus Limnocylindrales bacterium]
MTVTPFVGVSAGRSENSSASQPWTWSLAVVRSLVLVPALLLALAATFVAPASPTAAGSAGSLDLRATYAVTAKLNWNQSSLFVSSVAHVINTRDSSVGQLVFNALPTKLGRMRLIGASAGGHAAQAFVSGQSIIVTLPSAMGPGEERDVRIDYRALFNSDTRGKKALFMKNNSIAAAYRWIPWLSREQQFTTPNFGESWVTGVSDRVDVTFMSDVPLTYATSGWKTGGKGTTQSFTATGVRDFNFSASPSYRVTNVNWRGVDVQIFTRSTDPDRLWYWTRLALDRFSDKIGVYPYRHFTVAETPAGVGMESPGMIWIDSTLEQSRFPYIVVHETSHHWFFAVVGNNPATDPFVDEAMADFLTRDALASFRASSCGKTPLDKSVYEYSAACYAEVVYVQGGAYIRDYRDEVGAQNFWDALSALYRERGFDIVGTRGFWTFLDERTGFNSARHADRFPSLF